MLCLEETEMFDYESRHIIEALRSGVPSRAVGQYFSEARPKIMGEITGKIQKVIDTGHSSGMIYTGKYGEGKTHLLNTVFNISEERNMVVSFISLSKETPMDKLPVLYHRILENTYLPGHKQPGIMQKLEELTANSPAGSEMLMYCMRQLRLDKLYYLLRAYMSTEDADERFMLQADLEGDFIDSNLLKRIYKRIFRETVKYNVTFSKTKHIGEYFSFISHLFTALGYNGWVILVDETELMGRLGKKARSNGYRNMGTFLFPSESLKSTFTLFALSASYSEDVIESKHEYDNLAQYYPDDQEPMKSVLRLMDNAVQLLPLTQNEIRNVFERVKDFHSRAYDWYPRCTVEELINVSAASGYLLRTKIRSAIEYLDQLYQYGEAALNEVSLLKGESYTEEVSLESLDT